MDAPRIGPIGEPTSAKRRIACWLPGILVLLTAGIGGPGLSAERSADAASFQVAIPEREGWEVASEPNRVLMRRDLHVSGKRARTTAILALRTRPVESECGLPEQETAQRYCDEEEFQLWLNGQIKGLFGVSNLDRDTTVVGDKQVYSMRYQLEFAEEYGGARTDNLMYIYFPATFQEDNYFFVFMLTEACLPEFCPDETSAMDDTVLRQVMESLRVEPGRT